MFTFPVLTICLLTKEGKFVDEDFAHWASDHNTRWFDSNFYLSETVDSLANCCRLSSSIKEMMNDIKADYEEIWCHEDGTPATEDEIKQYLKEHPEALKN